nr:reverse transcriptase domain-containing protein [Tanacetum cinerariifolium]
MANTTPIVTTVTKTATKEKMPNGAEAAPRVNILDFFEEHYEDILPVMDKIRREKRKEVHTRLHFGENSRKSQRMREDSQNPSAKTLSARYLEDVLINGTILLAEIVLEVETAPTASKNRMVIPTPLTEQGTNIEEEDLAPRIRNFKSSWETRMPNNVKTYDGTGVLEDHVKIFQAAAQVERWAMPTWCHMFNSTLIGTARVWFDELPPESIDGYKDFKAAFLAYFMQQKKYVKDPVEIHNIKQKDGETIEDFMERFKVKTGRMKGAPECMRISGFMHGVNNPELTKRLNEHAPKTMEEMMTVTTAFIRGEIAATSKKKVHTPWKSQNQSKRHTSERKSHFQNQPKDGRGSNKFTPLTRTPKEIFAAELGKFKPPPPMVNPVEKRSSNKFCEFHNDKGHSTDECVRLRKLIEELLRPKIKNQMVPATTSLNGFSGETIWPLGQLRLLVTIGDAEHYTIAWMNFIIVRSPSPYNGIIGRPEIREIQAVPSTAHGMLKVPVNGEIVTIRSTFLTPTECTTIAATPKETAKKMAEQDEEKTAFHTSHGVYCYTKMPFGLKNAGATYQRLVDKAFDGQISRNLEIYVDDLVIKSNTETELLRGIEGTFRTLRKINMKLNPKKCTFGVAEGMFLGYMISPEGIKPCPDKTEAVLQLPSPRTIKEVQSFNGMLAISAVLMTERDTVQTPTYLVSRALQAPELNYTPMEKLVVALVCAAKRLRKYFKANPIVVITDQHIKQVISRARLILTNPEGMEFSYAQRFQFTASNNKAEYEALIAGLRIATQMGVRNVYVLVEILKEKSIQEREMATVVEKEGSTWMTPIIEYLRDETLPDNRKEASKLRKVKFLIVAMDYFTKWIEAKAVATITGSQVKKFVWDNLLCRFGLLGEIVSDNEKANKRLGEGIKARL